jgi:hypothetical protein
VNAYEAMVRLPGRTLTLFGKIRSASTKLLSFDEWSSQFGDGCHVLPVQEPSTRLYLTAPASGACFRDPFPGGIHYREGLSAAGPLLDSGAATQMFIFSAHDISISELTYTGFVTFEAPAGWIGLGSVTGPAALDRSRLMLNARHYLVIG